MLGRGGLVEVGVEGVERFWREMRSTWREL